MAKSKADVMRQIVEAPADPRPYERQPTLRFAEFSPDELSRMAKRLFILEPGNRQAMSHFGNAARLRTGREMRRSVLPTESETRAVTFDGLTLRFQSGPGPSDAFFSRISANDGLHEEGLLAYLKASIRPGDVLVDIGAHVGYVSCFAAAFGATVLAVEMQSTLVPVIAANAVANDLWSVHPINAAVGPAPGLAQTMRMDPSPGLMTHSERVQTNDFPPASINHDLVMRVAVDALVLEGHPAPAFVKVDVEGAEALVIAGARGLIAGEKTRFLVEIHPNLLPSFNSSRDQILNAFPRDRWRAGLLRDDGRVDDVDPADFAREATRDDNYMIVFEPLAMSA